MCEMCEVVRITTMPSVRFLYHIYADASFSWNHLASPAVWSCMTGKYPLVVNQWNCSIHVNCLTKMARWNLNIVFNIIRLIILLANFCFLTDPPEQFIDDITVEDFTSLINFNLVNYFTFSKVRLNLNKKMQSLQQILNICIKMRNCIFNL